MVGGGGSGRDTLLSPEISIVRLFLLALRDRFAAVGGGLARVGVDLVNWIVDASIFCVKLRALGVPASVLSLSLFVGGGVGGGLVVWGCCLAQKFLNGSLCAAYL